MWEASECFRSLSASLRKYSPFMWRIKNKNDSFELLSLKSFQNFRKAASNMLIYNTYILV